MPTLQVDRGNALFYLHAPATPGGRSFVFFNALTGDTAMWEGTLGERLRDAGHGTLSFNYRGQADRPFTPGTRHDSRTGPDDRTDSCDRRDYRIGIW